MEFGGFIGGSYTLKSISADAQRTVNLYPETNESGQGKSVASLIFTPGLKLLSTLGIGPNRGLFTTAQGRSFAVSGAILYEVTAPLVPVSRGTLESAIGPVSMSDNGVHLIVADGAKGYILKLSDNTFLQITDEDFPKASHVAFIDQYLIANDTGDGNFFLSGLSDAPDWDGLDFAAAEGSPDNLQTLLTDHEQLILIGSESTEVWVDTGAADFPFERVSGGYLEFGTIAPWSAQKLASTFIYLAQDKNGSGQVMQVAGINGQRVSTYAIEYALSKSTSVSGATSWTYQDAGHTFYCLNAPGLKTTLCLDVSTGLWHERQSALRRHRAENHCVASGMHLVGDYENGNLYQLTDDADTDNGEPKVWRRRSPHLSKETVQIAHYEFILDMKTLNLTGGADPKVGLRYSNNGGHTFGPERWTSPGKVGEYSKRARWERLGQGRDRVYEAFGEGNVVLTAAYLNLGAGIH